MMMIIIYFNYHDEHISVHCLAAEEMIDDAYRMFHSYTILLQHVE
jgi:hypothetical protein